MVAIEPKPLRNPGPCNPYKHAEWLNDSVSFAESIPLKIDIFWNNHSNFVDAAKRIIIGCLAKRCPNSFEI